MLSTRRVGFWLVLSLLGLGLAACSDSTTPPAGTQTTGSTLIQGYLDPGSGDWVLKTLDVETPDGRPLRIQLVAGNVSVDPDSQLVSLEVGIRNLEPDTLYGPAVIWLQEFDPLTVSVHNADFVHRILWDGPLTDEAPLGVFGFDYSDLLGPDQKLPPGATSGRRTWIFFNPGLAPFSFGVRAQFGLVPVGARIAGRCWFDQNHNGLIEADERPLGMGEVHLTYPDGGHATTLPNPDGFYSFPVTQVGLYEVSFDPMLDTVFVPLAFSTPNPREIILLPGPDGNPQSFLDANFGVYADIPVVLPPIQFTTDPPDSLHHGFWQWLDAEVKYPFRLEMEVGYSGCSPDQPFSLYMTGGFRESEPVQAQLVLVHEVEEACDAAFEGELEFGLEPLVRKYMAAYGPGVLRLQIMDFEGVNHAVDLGVYLPD